MPRVTYPRKGRPAPRRRWGRWLVLLIVLGGGIAFWKWGRPLLPRDLGRPTPERPLPPTPAPSPSVPGPERRDTPPPVPVNPVPTPVPKVSAPAPAPTRPPVSVTTNPPTRIRFPTNPPPVAPPIADATPFVPRPATNLLEAQIALAQRGFGSGSIDGVGGAQTEWALRAFQYQQGLEETGRRDRDTDRALLLSRPPLTRYTLQAADLARLRPVPETWLGKSEVPRLDYATLLELMCEKTHAHPNLLRRLNPDVAWDSPVPGTELVVPDTEYPAPKRAALVRISLAGRYLRAYDDAGNLLVHFPVSIGRVAEKRPVGALAVVVSVKDPNYTFDPAVFPESQEGRELGRKLLIPPGPNNPVGVAWIGLNRPGYGIHGTPVPEQVGRTESHGCFRLANWNAEHLRRMVTVGTPVHVEK